jgi:glycosyltransferase 2 family protein
VAEQRGRSILHRTSHFKSIAITTLKIAVPLLIISWLLWRIEPEQWDLLRNQRRDYPLLAAALAAALTAVCISFVRWWALVRCQGINLRLIEALRLGSIGFLLSFVSAGSVGGDLFKAIFLARRSPGKTVEAVASVVVDRGVGLLGLLLLVAWAISAAGRTSNPDLVRIGNASLGLSVVGLVMLAGLVLGGRGIDQLILWGSELRYIGGVVNRIAGPLRVFHKHPIILAWSLVMSLAVHGLLVLSAFWIARSLYGAAAPGLGDHALIFPIANLASAMPIAPAGLGVLEAAMEWLYRIVPAEPTIASGTLVALVYEIVKVILAALGILFYWTAGPDVRRSLQQVRSSVVGLPGGDR